MTTQTAGRMAGASAELTNDDLSPTPPEGRTWTWYHFACLWLGMVISIPAYLLAGGLIDRGLSPLAAIGCVLIGNIVILVPIALIGHAGARYGIPYAVLARAAFGTRGAAIPAIARALVACGWYGIQTWVGGKTLLALIELSFGLRLTGTPLPLLDISLAELLAFAAFWVLQLFVVNKGLTAVRRFETWTAPLKLLILFALLGWAVGHLGGPGATWARLAAGTTTKPAEFWPALTAMIGFWATLALNIPDFTRFARSQRDQLAGQALGLPLPMALLASVSVITTYATIIVYGEAIWDPVALAGRMEGLAVFIGLLVIAIDTISCNIAANLVGPAYDFSAIWPQRISYRRGALITALIAAAIMPWKLIATSQGYIFTWLVGYSALLGPIAGILVADYWLLRRRTLDVDALYDRAGRYSYAGGYNRAAILALILGVLPNVPGFLAAAIPALAPAIPAGLTAIYPYAWFVGAAVSGLAHLLFARLVAGAHQPSTLSRGSAV